MKKDTPMMSQYRRIKSSNKDSILLFRLGDFYEMFESDAITASSILNITLTKRNNIPMCGFPHHAADTYIAKFLREGKKIAICEQQEDPKLCKGIVKRDVVEIISPGIITDPNLLNNKSSNCIAAIYGYEKKGKITLACASLDISTGEFLSNFFSDGDILDNLLNEIADNGIREIIYPEGFKESDPLYLLIEKMKDLAASVVFRGVDEYQFNEIHAEEVLKAQFSVLNADVFGFQSTAEKVACGAVLSYVKEDSKQDISHVRWVRGKKKEGFLIIDNATKRHLELTVNQIDGTENITLLSILDRTKTAMGGRLLKKYIHNPLRSAPEIKDRLHRVDYFFKNRDFLEDILRPLSNILDLARILAKLSVGKGNARDLIALKNSLCSVNRIKEKLNGIELFIEQVRNLSDFGDIIKTIESGIVDDPPLSVKEGGFIKKGYNKRLDEFKKITLENRQWINRFQAEEQKKQGISSLKVKYNKIIGYYIEVTKPNLHLIPPYYIKKQTLVNSERFTTEELQGHEILLMEAREDANRIEFSIFEEIRSFVLQSIKELLKTSETVAQIDVFQALASAAQENNYTKPEIVDENIIDIKGGRHPVIEKYGEERFIENDLDLNDDDRRVMILTGPNMAGKSTFLRQAALMVIMAHMGSFIPARKARIGIVDRVFSRIGASDRLVKGESTFLVEMIETSRILHYATERSFIIMDEIGRGTSTYDGLSIAWAVLEYLLDVDRVGAKVLFATHYHEITNLKDSYGVITYNATVKEWNNTVIFLRKILPGIASKSYGIEVARMAGIHDSIIDRAKSILHKLESEYGSYMPMPSDKIDKAPVSVNNHGSRGPQLDLFPSPYEILAKELKQIDIDEITPLEALNILDRLKKSLLI